MDGAQLARLVTDTERQLLRPSGEPTHGLNIPLTETNACKRQSLIDLQLGCREFFCKRQCFRGVAPCRGGVPLAEGQRGGSEQALRPIDRRTVTSSEEQTLDPFTAAL